MGYVRSHYRRGYYRRDGTYVSGTTVRSHYRSSSSYGWTTPSVVAPTVHVRKTPKPAKDTVVRNGRNLYRRIVDGEWIWEWFEDGEWVEVWSGYLPPSTTDLEDLVPIELLELADKHGKRSSDNNSTTTKNASGIHLDMNWHSARRNCIVVTETIPGSTIGTRRKEVFYKKEAWDAKHACETIAKHIESESGKHATWTMPDEPESPIKPSVKPFTIKTWYVVALAIILSLTIYLVYLDVSSIPESPIDDPESSDYSTYLLDDDLSFDGAWYLDNEYSGS